MTGFSLTAPAKLNLFLHITGRREDGYHTLQTLFALLDTGDQLDFAPSDDLLLDAPAPLDTEDNLVLRAARALKAASGYAGGAHLTLHKRLPAGGGVGGGSSDAATTLLGLNRLWQLGLSRDQLAHIGLSLGADVPVFVHGHSAWAEGVGEQLTPVSLPEQLYLVVNPAVSVPTAQIFGDRQLTRDTPKSRLAAFLEPGSASQFGNDCEPVARRLFPAVADALDWLDEHAGNARMTGTGACVFARIASRTTGEKLLAQLPERWTGFVACSVDRSPALDEIEALEALQATTS
ncbi:MAG: 4-(cytidine 5'-diphospho)-2-C-methyl-D-erythritol kinase [Alcanivoracaceae bacterium]|nr:4-(cytidine 5'-diphospho)-2-C-methyl-D-erythritol kinase [Alcanivoracaceae bacterium]